MTRVTEQTGQRQPEHRAQVLGADALTCTPTLPWLRPREGSKGRTRARGEGMELRKMPRCEDKQGAGGFPGCPARRGPD